MSLDEVLEVARAGERAGCREALFTLGDKPELRYRRRARASSPRSGSRLDDRVPRRGRARRARGDLAAAAPQPGRPHRRRFRAPAAGRRLDGDDARDDLRPALGARRAALRLARQAARCAPRDAPARGRGAGPVHDRDPDRDRRDARGADRGARGDRRRRPAGAGGDRPELPREAGNADGRRARAAARGAPLDDRRRPADPAPRGRAAGAAEPDRGLRPAARRRDRRLGRRLPGHDRPRQPRGAVARARPAARCDREPRPRARAAPDRLPGAHRRRVDRPGVLPRVLRAADSLGLAREDAWSPGETGEIPFVVRRDPLPLACGRRARRGRDRPPLPRPRRGAPARASRPPTRSAAR